MGCIRKTKSGKFETEIRLAGLQRDCKLFDTREDAQGYIDDMEPKLRAKRDKERASNRKPRKAAALKEVPLLSEKLHAMLSEFVEQKLATARQLKTLPTILDNVDKEVRIADIDKDWVRAYIKKLQGKATRVGRPFANSTIANHLKIMYAICRARAETLRIECPHLPFSTKLLPKGWDTQRFRRLHPEEAKALKERMASLGDGPWGRQWRILVDFAIETGARQQELIWSTWNCVDVENQAWIIPAAITKTKKERQVPLSPYATRLARELQSMGFAPTDRIFNVLSEPAAVSAYFRKIRLEAGIVDFTFHDLRHEACARMVREGVPETMIMDIVGHSDSKMLARYANLTMWEKVELLNAAKEGRPPRRQVDYSMHAGDRPALLALPNISDVEAREASAPNILVPGKVNLKECAGFTAYSSISINGRSSVPAAPWALQSGRPANVVHCENQRGVEPVRVRWEGLPALPGGALHPRAL